MGSSVKSRAPSPRTGDTPSRSAASDRGITSAGVHEPSRATTWSAETSCSVLADVWSEVGLVGQRYQVDLALGVAYLDAAGAVGLTSVPHSKAAAAPGRGGRGPNEGGQTGGRGAGSPREAAQGPDGGEALGPGR